MLNKQSATNLVSNSATSSISNSIEVIEIDFMYERLQELDEQFEWTKEEQLEVNNIESFLGEFAVSF